MNDATNNGWSTPRFLVTLLIIDFVAMFLLNGVLNETLHLGVPGWLLGVAPTMLSLVLLPRWGWFRRQMQKRTQSS